MAVAHHCSDSTSGQWFGRALGEVDACDVFERDWEFGEWCFKRHLALSNADHLTAHAVFIGEENEILVALLFGHIVAAGDFAVPFRKANLAQGDGVRTHGGKHQPLGFVGEWVILSIVPVLDEFLVNEKRDGVFFAIHADRESGVIAECIEVDANIGAHVTSISGPVFEFVAVEVGVGGVDAQAVGVAAAV